MRLLAVILWLTSVSSCLACSGETLPFQSLRYDNAEFRLFSDNCLSNGVRSIHGRDVVPLHIVNGAGGAFIVGREQLSGFLSVRRLDGSDVGLSYDERAGLIPFHAFEFDGRAFLVVYDVLTTLPSGRRRETPRERNDIYELTGLETPLRKVAELPGGFDGAVFDVAVSGGRLVCSLAGCLKFKSGGTEQVALPVGRQLLELASDGTKAFGLFQVEYDDRVTPAPADRDNYFFVCEIGGTCESAAAAIVPFRLKVENGKASFDTLNRDNADELIRFDLTRLRSEYSMPNTEGRVAWSGVYYVNGLLTLADGSSKLAADAAQRATLELDRIARLALSEFPGLSVKRYSLNREPVLSLLHSGRVARLLARGKGSPDAIDKLRDILTTGRGTIEEITDTGLRFKPYAPIWADGAPAPWNYTSGWIEGLAVTGALADAGLRKRVAAIIKRMVETEGLATASTWHYGAGDVRFGWSGGVSTNTPSWGGDKGAGALAHISYRTMDAMAMLAAAKAGVDVPAPVLNNIKRLVSEGRLYPFTCENLPDCKIPASVARQYARAVLPWQVQNQPWAIRALTH